MNLTFAIKSQARSVSVDLVHDPEWEKFVMASACYEPEVVNAMIRFVRPGDYVIDAGANLGFFTVMLSKLVGEEGEVLAFEPDPKFLAQLHANLELNDCKNVQTFDKVLWHTDEDIGFHLNELGGYSSVLHYSCGTIKSMNVTARSLDSFIDDAPKFRLIKIDCEGSEERILHGAEQMLLRGIDFVIVEMNPHLMPHMRTTEKMIRDYMSELGYQMFLLNPYGDAPRPIGPDEVLIETGYDEDYPLNVLFSTETKVNEAWAPETPR